MANILVDIKGEMPVIEDMKLIPGKYAICRFRKSKDNTIALLVEPDGPLKDRLIYSNKTGWYMIKDQLTKDELLVEQFTMGTGNFPYTFERYYEALESFSLFDNKQSVDKTIPYELSKYLDYTFGIEYETSEGYMPEDKCFKNGIIPLRDGSISGLEYSTVVLEGNKGLNLVREQIKTLKEHTFFNKECSLHMHLGGYPEDPMAIYAAYRVCYYIQNEIYWFLPKMTFNTADYKSSGKDYCKKLQNYPTFNDFYQAVACQKYLGSLRQPHPNDAERNHKWDCRSRYVCVNFVNMLCYDKCKTVEFRFLRPTYNFKKIYYWIAIFNAILKYSLDVFGRSDKTEKGIENIIFEDNTSMPTILHTVYPEEFANKVCDFIDRLYIAVANQHTNGDYIGRDTELEDKIIGTRL